MSGPCDRYRASPAGAGWKRGLDMDLQDACVAWQGGMSGGSSPIRAAARNLTGIRHYFRADFIDKYEEDARRDEPTTQRARTLLDALAASPLRTPAEWAEELNTGSSWVGRGIKKGTQDQQILQSLATGEITMPLWGASFDPDIARHYGDRFTFIVHGPFPAIPAWIHSGIVAEELELICGGRYEIIEPPDLTAEKIEVHLRFLELPAVDATPATATEHM